MSQVQNLNSFGSGGGGGSGTVTSVSVVTANGLSGTVATATTTPAITLKVTGTSGGIPYFSATDTVASTGALTASAVLKGGGAGNAPIASGVTIDDTTNALYGYKGKINAQSGTTYTLTTTDTGKIVELSNASAITLTLPNSLGVGFCCRIVQTGAGQVTLAAASGATLRNRQSFTKTAGQWAELDIYVTTNSNGSLAVYIMGGDGA